MLPVVVQINLPFLVFCRIFAHSKTPDRMKHAYVFPGEGSQVAGSARLIIKATIDEGVNNLN